MPNFSRQRRSYRPGTRAPSTPFGPSAARRITIVLVVVVVLVGIPQLLGKAAKGHLAASLGNAPAGAARASLLGASVAPTNAGNSDFYCTGASDAPDGLVPMTIELANNGAVPLTVIVRSVSQSGATKSVSVTLARSSHAAVGPQELVSGSYIAADVSANGGGLAVFELSQGPKGRSVSPCASVTSATWYMTGATVNNDSKVLYFLYDPLATPVIADMSFFGINGPIPVPSDQGIVVAPRSLEVVDSNQGLFGNREIGAVVQARTGRLVAFQLQLEPPAPASGAQASLSVVAASGAVATTLGSTHLASRWYFPQGAASGSQAESLDFLNTANSSAKISIFVKLDAGAAEPLSLEVPGESEVIFPLGQQVRIPQNVGHAIEVSVESGPPVLVSQWIGSPDQGDPAPQGAWLSIVPGAISSASSWVCSIDTTSSPYGAVIVAQNQWASPVNVTINIGPSEPVATETIPPHGHVVVPLSAAQVATASDVTVISSGRPVNVEQELLKLGFTAYAASLAMPVNASSPPG